MEKTIRDDAMVGLQTETVGAHASTRSGLNSTLVATLHFLVHPRTRRKAAVEASAEKTERTRRQEHDLGASRSPFEAGITGGFSLLMDNSNARHRR